MKIALTLLILLGTATIAEARAWCDDHRSQCSRDWGQSHRSYRDYMTPRGYYNNPDRYRDRNSYGSRRGYGGGYGDRGGRGGRDRY